MKHDCQFCSKEVKVNIWVDLCQLRHCKLMLGLNKYTTECKKPHIHLDSSILPQILIIFKVNSRYLFLILARKNSHDHLKHGVCIAKIIMFFIHMMSPIKDRIKVKSVF